MEAKDYAGLSSGLNFQQQIISDLVNGFLRKKEAVVNETLEFFYGLKPCEEVYKRLHIVTFEEQPDTEYFYLDLPTYNNFNDVPESDKKLVAMFRTNNSPFPTKEPFKMEMTGEFYTPYKECSLYNH